MRKFSFVAATMLLAVPFSVGCFSSHEEPPSANAEAEIEKGTIAWKPCPNPIYPEAECGIVTVPVDWSKPDGETLPMNVYRLKATRAGKPLGTLWFASGTPSLWFDKRPGEEHAPSARLREYFDIVGFDARGTSNDEPIACDPELSKKVAAHDNRRPANQAEYEQWSEQVRALGEDCLQRHGALFAHFDDFSVARDIDAFRSALGEEKLNVYARSVVTSLAATYAEMFPHRLRTLVFDSNRDHSVDTATLLSRFSGGLDSSFAQFIDWARRTPGSVLYGKNVQSLWDRLYTQAKAGELIDPNTGKPMQVYTLLQGATLPMDRQPQHHSWGELAQRLADLDAGRSTPGWDPEPEADYSSGAGYGAADECENWDYTDVADFAALDGAYRAADTRLVHVHEAFETLMHSPATCRGWPIAVLNPQHRLSIQGGPKVLVVNSRHDFQTSYDNAVAVHEQIPGSVLLTYEGVGHGTYNRSPCIRGQVELYLMTGLTPASDTSCPAIWPAAQE
ncbi:alpha/beta hydrolase [Pendulispora brunnea]|uniref:Alpha/beta hydrolase n=1 Tax=Pendulispora brunnea TaxID=2905690 RepID=A0ABZ2KBY3_9BACT